MKNRLILLLISTCFLASCHSTNPTTGTTTVSGQVVQYQTTKGVPNATVQVYHASSGGGYVPVGSGYPADATGHFAFAFAADSKTGYLLLANAPPGYSTDWALAPSLTAGRSNDNIIIPTYAPAWVKLQLVDEPPKSRVVIHTQGYDGPGDTFYYPRDTAVVRPLLTGFKSAVFWWVREQGTEQPYSQKINPAALDTVIVRIPF
ncbi:hypothetical protein A0257_11130 [Hymenobacter psoromatis]|nr:hypothetical protein A0257_11130 [Hymenobacter psoromatis]